MALHNQFNNNVFLIIQKLYQISCVKKKSYYNYNSVKQTRCAEISKYLHILKVSFNWSKKTPEIK